MADEISCLDYRRIKSQYAAAQERWTNASSEGWSANPAALRKSAQIRTETMFEMLSLSHLIAAHKGKCAACTAQDAAEARERLQGEAGT